MLRTESSCSSVMEFALIHSVYDESYWHTICSEQGTSMTIHITKRTKKDFLFHMYNLITRLSHIILYCILYCTFVTKYILCAIHMQYLFYTMFNKIRKIFFCHKTNDYKYFCISWRSCSSISIKRLLISFALCFA